MFAVALVNFVNLYDPRHFAFLMLFFLLTLHLRMLFTSGSGAGFCGRSYFFCEEHSLEARTVAWHGTDDML